MEILENIDLGKLASEVEAVQVTHEVFIAAAAISIVTGIFVGIFGLKLVRLLSSLTGFLLGAVIGLVAAVLLGLSDTVLLAVTFGGAVVFAIAGFILRKVGMFIWVFVSFTGVFGNIVYQQGAIWLVVGAVLGLIAAILSVKYFEPLIIIATSIVGARSIASGVLLLVGMENNLIINIVAFVAVLAICVMTQFGMHSRKIQKKEENQASKLREQESREKEIEMARMLLDDEE